LQNDQIAPKLIGKYGEAAYKAAFGKSLAIVDVNAAEVFPAEEGYKQYSRIRQGLPQDENMPTLHSSDLEFFVSKPFHEVPRAPLVYDVEESKVILDALRHAYAFPVKKGRTNIVSKDSFSLDEIDIPPEREGDALAAADVLARYSPSHIDRAFYGAVIDQAVEVNQHAGKAPHYDTVA
jgi:hypothetical protein